jgi:hypothetical protein
MEQLAALPGYLQHHPVATIGALIGLIVLYRLLNRKPKIVRDADERLQILRRETENKYDQIRPLR